MTDSPLPLPPLALANRVGSLEGASDPLAYYEELGRNSYRDIVERLPYGWTFAGKRILDFGCGAGRTLRHFAPLAAEAEVWGCDIDEASVTWLRDHLCPPFQVFTNGPEPPLDQPSASFDLIWAVSVFTHLTDNWADWLVELHRLLRADGLLFLTFMGSGMSQLVTGQACDDSQVGMNVLKYEQTWELGGPMVLHSPWWIEEHWGRAFEIVSLIPDGFAGGASAGQGSVMLRKRDTPVDAEMLERVTPADAREMRALSHNLAQVHSESLHYRTACAYLQGLLDTDLEEQQLAEGRVADLDRRLRVLEGSRSWKLTKPLRAVARQLRGAARR